MQIIFNSSVRTSQKTYRFCNTKAFQLMFYMDNKFLFIMRIICLIHEYSLLEEMQTFLRV
jgi:hypothetical protein